MRDAVDISGNERLRIKLLEKIEFVYRHDRLKLREGKPLRERVIGNKNKNPK